jgi:hypothetical protein
VNLPVPTAVVNPTAKRIKEKKGRALRQLEWQRMIRTDRNERVDRKSVQWYWNWKAGKKNVEGQLGLLEREGGGADTHGTW